MPYEEIEYIDKRLKELQTKQQQLPAAFEMTRAQVDRQIEHLMEQAGILGQVRALEKQKEEAKTKAQREADQLGGRISELRIMRDRLLQLIKQWEAEEAQEDPEPEEVGYDYPEELYGIQLAKLDNETRLLVMAGKRETIEVLGGTPPEDSG